MTELTKNQAKRKRHGGKHRTQVPWTTGKVADDLLDYLKKQAKLKQANRKIKKIKKLIDKMKKENKDGETTDTVSQGEEGQDIQLGLLGGGLDDQDGIRD